MKIQTLFAFIASAALAAAAPAQTKISGTVRCSRPDPAYAIPIGDQPGHTYGLSKSVCTWTTPMEIAGIATKDGADVGSSEMQVGKSMENGVHWSTMTNGDKMFVRYHGTSMLDKDGNPTASEGHWAFTGGTGKIEGITGNGTYKGKANADGSFTFEVEGHYRVPMMK
jgi:hypothetical protein